MVIFTIKDVDKLKKYLEICMIHDGTFDKATYNQKNRRFSVIVNNIVWNEYIELEFCGIYKFAVVPSTQADFCFQDVINGLTIINNSALLSCNVGDCLNDFDRAHYLCTVFELMSGWEIYIACEKVIIRNKTGEGSLSSENTE